MLRIRATRLLGVVFVVDVVDVGQRRGVADRQVDWLIDIIAIIYMFATVGSIDHKCKPSDHTNTAAIPLNGMSDSQGCSMPDVLSAF